MTNKTITLPREVGEMILRNRDRLGSGIIDPVRAALADPVPPACCTCGKPTACGKMICEECCYEPLPVPPAGVEPEVLARVCKGHVLGWGLTGYLSVEIGTELVDRAHVTRLQAEVERLRGGALQQVCDHLNEKVEALQSELTKALELLEHMLKDDDMPVYWFAQRIDDFRANHSAPADKGPLVRCSFCDVTDSEGNPWTGASRRDENGVIYRISACKNHKHLGDAAISAAKGAEQPAGKDTR